MKVFLSILSSIFVLGLLTICAFFAYSMYESNQLNNKAMQANQTNQEVENTENTNNIENDDSQVNSDSTQNFETPQNAEACLLDLIENNRTCSLDDYSNQELAEAYESLIDQGQLDFWCHPGGDIGAVKKSITESISNKQNGIVCERDNSSDSENDSNVVTRDNVFDYLIEAIDSEEGNNHNLITFQQPKMKDGYWEIAGNNKSGVGSYTFKVYLDGTVEFWNGPNTDMSMSKKVVLD
ncbi:hypothetical protein NGB24_08885 [Mammaliicoccus vitulinus]|uniref:hypothetical protein n=1 Tax=Mammaliicoccus vitulinus TaxID=71237 RepID=UPI002DC060DD|nr:hypothetical protein [Mammaliicoccus vitulinus]MEB7657976.1 hypothetical protein [Mammaliicoccus vitulinus]